MSVYINSLQYSIDEDQFYIGGENGIATNIENAWIGVDNVAVPIIFGSDIAKSNKYIYNLYNYTTSGSTNTKTAIAYTITEYSTASAFADNSIHDYNGTNYLYENVTDSMTEYLYHMYEYESVSSDNYIIKNEVGTVSIKAGSEPLSSGSVETYNDNTYCYLLDGDTLPTYVYNLYKNASINEAAQTITSFNFDDYFSIKKWYKTSDSSGETELTDNTYIINNTTSDGVSIKIGNGTNYQSTGYYYGFTLYPKKNMTLKPSALNFSGSVYLDNSSEEGYWQYEVDWFDEDGNFCGDSTYTDLSEVSYYGSSWEADGGTYKVTSRWITTSTTEDERGGRYYIQVHYTESNGGLDNPYTFGPLTSTSDWPSSANYTFSSNEGQYTTGYDWIKIYYQPYYTTDKNYGLTLSGISVNSVPTSITVNSSNFDSFFNLQKWYSTDGDTSNFKHGTKTVLADSNTNYIINNSDTSNIKIQIGNNTKFTSGYFYGFTLYPKIDLTIEKQKIGFSANNTFKGAYRTWIGWKDSTNSNATSPQYFAKQTVTTWTCPPGASLELSANPNCIEYSGSGTDNTNSFISVFYLPNASYLSYTYGMSLSTLTLSFSIEKTITIMTTNGQPYQDKTGITYDGDTYYCELVS